MADDAGLQCRLDAGGTIFLEPGSPGYIVNSGLMLKQHGTKLISSAIPQLATVIAGQNLWNWILIRRLTRSTTSRSATSTSMAESGHRRLAIESLLRGS